jgi:hypothetical protein
MSNIGLIDQTVRLLLFLSISSHSHNKLIAKGYPSLDNVQMAIRRRVEGTRIQTFSELSLSLREAPLPLIGLCSDCIVQ